jgi:hypothetical protein
MDNRSHTQSHSSEAMQFERAYLRLSVGCSGNDVVTNHRREGAEDGYASVDSERTY